MAGHDSFTEVTSRSWVSRITSSLKGILFGIVLIVAATALLWWNEGRAVKTAKSLQEGAAAVVSVAADKVDAANDGKLVHVIGMATTAETLGDGEFGVSANALRLRRSVLMYQWTEKSESNTERKLGGGEETKTTYAYEKSWASELISSSEFKKPEGHTNPSTMRFGGNTLDANVVSLGAFRLTADLVRMIDKFEPLPVASEQLNRMSEALKKDAKLSEGGYYIGADPASPQIGDLKVGFQLVKPGDVSIIARQAGESFEPYVTKVGRPIQLLRVGSSSAELMFQKAQASNSTLTWLLRFVGVIVMWIGFAALLAPLAVLADVLPFLGGIVRAGTGAAAGIVALAGSLAIVVLAWIFYRPVLAIILLLVGGAAIYGITRLIRNKKRMPAPATNQCVR